MMETEREFLNRIRWDKRLKPEEFGIEYLDRIENRLIAIRFTDIKRIEGGFMVVEGEGQETMIPLHRIRRITEKGKAVWQRKTGAQ